MQLGDVVALRRANSANAPLGEVTQLSDRTAEIKNGGRLLGWYFIKKLRVVQRAAERV